MGSLQDVPAVTLGATVAQTILLGLEGTDVADVIVGNVLVYKDNSHMTVDFAEALVPLLDRALFKS